MGAGRDSTHGPVHIDGSVAAVHHDGPVAKQRSNPFHHRRNKAQVYNDDRARGIVEPEPRSRLGERKFLQREML
jgi:hypothetical protein